MSVAAVASEPPDSESMGANLSLAGRFDIWPDQPLPSLALPHARVFAASDRLMGDRPLMALLPDPSVVPRHRLFDPLKSLPLPDLIAFVAWGIVDWPGSEGEGRSLALLFDRPAGPALVSRIDPVYPDLDESDLIHKLIEPASRVLRIFENLDLTHRAIHPMNLHFRKEDGGLVQLGECVSAPPGSTLPPAFETVEQLMAEPAGRSGGCIADDLYALGVTVLALHLRSDPAHGRDRRTLLAERIARGSYAALVGAHRLPAALREILRGLLEDRTDRRWTLDDVFAWLHDRRPKPRIQALRETAERPFLFQGVSFDHPRRLGAALAEHWDRAAHRDLGHDLLKWARHSLPDDHAAETLFSAMELSRRPGGAGDGVLNPALGARLCQALDRQAPIRFKGIGFHGEGLGAMLAAHWEDESLRNILHEALIEDLPAFQLRAGVDGAGTIRTRIQAMTRLAKVAADQGLGNGIERVLYESNPLQPCLSPLIRDKGVIHIQHLLPALNAQAPRGEGHGSRPIDRHIAAFAAARSKAPLAPFLQMVGDDASPERSTLGLIGTLAAVEAASRSGGAPTAYPALCRWLIPDPDLIIGSYRHRIWREKVANELPALIREGDLGLLYAYLADGDARRRDNDGFAKAVEEHAALVREIANLRSFGISDPERTRTYGHQLAAGISGLLAFAAIAVTLVFML